MTKRRKMQIASVTIAAILVLGGTTATGYITAEQYRSQMEYTYRRALNDLNDYVANIETTLQKAVYTATPPQQTGVMSKLMQEASGAKASLAALPLENGDLENVSRFLSQVGDFSSVLSSKISEGNTLSQEEFESVNTLLKYAKELHTDLEDVMARFSDGSLSIGSADSLLQNLDAGVPTFSSHFTDAEEHFTDYPTLIYDGPFSDHINQRTPRLLEGLEEVHQGNAQNSAAEFLGIESASLSHTADTEGNLPTYNFTQGDIRIGVSRTGGIVVSMLNPREIAESTMGYEEALQKAKDFCAARGIENLKESYYVIHDNICTINFAFLENNILYYPDLIKVSVALDNGEIVEYDAAGYIMNHTERNLPEPKVTLEQAQAVLSPALTVNASAECVIPTGGLNEVRCYEFSCSAENGDNVLVYIDTQTGYEEQILIVLASDNGILTK